MHCSALQQKIIGHHRPSPAVTGHYSMQSSNNHRKENLQKPDLSGAAELRIFTQSKQGYLEKERLE
jgi:hypothetical protein